MPEITKSFADFPAEHALRHRLRPDGRESLAHMLMMPEHGIAGFIYPSIRATGPAKARAYLFGPSLPEPVHETIEADVAPDMDFDAWQTGPLLMAVREPHKVVDLEWNGNAIRFKSRITALHPPYAFSSHPGGNPPYYGDDRTEQHGRIVADVTVAGRTLHHEGFHIRDHSWGPRIWGINQHHKWIHAVTPACSIHVFEMQSYGRTHIRGFLWRDGVMRHIARVECEPTYDGQMMQQGLRIDLCDTDGRTAQVTCTAFASIQLTEWDPNVYLNEAAYTLSIDGEPGVGWAEFCWNRNYFDFAQPYVTRFG